MVTIPSPVSINQKSHHTSLFKGVLWKIVNIMIYTCTNLIFISLKTEINIMQEWSISNLLTLLTLFPFIILIRKKHIKIPRGPYLQNYIYRGVIVFIAYITWIKAMREIGIHTATALGYTGPILTAILASIVNKEPWQIRSITATIIGLLCALFILMPDLCAFSASSFATIALSVVLYSLYEILCKQQTAANQLEQTFFVLFVTTIVGLPFLLADVLHIVANISFSTILTLWGVGLLRAVNTMALFLSYKYASLNMLQPFSYLKLPFTAFGTYMLYGQLPTFYTLGAVSIIVLINILHTAAWTKKHKATHSPISENRAFT